MARTFVIVGAGLCGAAAAQALRDEGFDGRIVLIGDEKRPPYERPPLSKEYLRGERPFDAFVVHPESWYETNEIDLRLGTLATRVDPAARRVEIDGGEGVAYDALLLATGGRPRRLPHGASDALLYLRTAEDADRIRGRLESSSRLVVVGAGWIGAEVAASARSMGVEVAVLEVLETPLQQALGVEIGRVIAEIHREHGVELRTGEGVDSLDSGDGWVRIRTTRGEVIESDAAVVGVGIDPNVELGRSAGATIDNGIVVDEFCATGVDGIFAAGDVANHFHPLFGRHVRVEHFDNALKHGAAAARGMLGLGRPYDDPHWFWSDQYEHNLQYAGFSAERDRIAIRGDPAARSFIAFFLEQGRVRAAFGLNRGPQVRRAMRLIRESATPDPAALEDEGVDLRTLS